MNREMTRELAQELVSTRWENLGLDKSSCPIMFQMDVNNMVNNPEHYWKMDDDGKWILPE